MPKRKSDVAKSNFIEEFHHYKKNYTQENIIEYPQKKRVKFADISESERGQVFDTNVKDITYHIINSHKASRITKWNWKPEDISFIPSVNFKLLSIMYGDRTNQYGASEQSQELFEPIKDIADIKPNLRRCNDYTTIPRKSRSHGHHSQTGNHHPQTSNHHAQTGNHHSQTGNQHSSVYRIKPEYIVQSTSQDVCEPTRDSLENISKLSGSGSNSDSSEKVTEQKKPRAWTFKRLKNVLKRSKSLKNEKSETIDSESSQSGSSEPKVSGILFSTIDPAKAARTSQKTVHHNNNDIYADIDNLHSGSKSHKDISDSTSCRSGNSGSSMSVTLPGYTSGLDPEKASQKTSVLKALSSITLRNIGTRKSTSQKKSKTDPDYEHSEFVRDKYRGSFNDNTVVGKRLSDTSSDCRRCRSFTMSAVEKSQRTLPVPGSPRNDTQRDSGIYSKQTEYETRDGEMLYSLAKADDSPPPLPERTYLKIRQAGSKENNTPDNSYKVPPQRISFPLQEENNNYKPAAYPRTVPEHLHIDHRKPLHSMSPVPRRRRRDHHNTAKPFSLHHLADGDQHTISSGYSSSIGSDTLSAEVDYPRMAPPPPPSTCTLPRRSRHLVSKAPRTFAQNTHVPDCYSNKDTERLSATGGGSSLGDKSKHQDSDEDELDQRLRSNIIHNLPLPPGPGGAQLISTLQLDSILKNKWISGIAVTKKNEYIVVDQREAYLIDEEGSLKKVIGAKNSGRLIEPFNVCVSPSNGNLVICDHAEQDIKIFSWKGQFLKKVKDPGLTNIAGVAVTESKDIVIAGTDKQRISILTEDGELSCTIPSVEDIAKPKSRLPFEHPYTVAVNPLTGDIIIGDDYKHMVTAVSPGQGGQGTRVLWRYSPGSGDRHFFPSSICADSKGYIFIADLYNEKVYMLDSSGKFVKTLLSRGDGLRGGPGAIAADGRGHLLVADEEKTIKVFKYRDENGFAVNKRYSYCPQAT